MWILPKHVWLVVLCLSSSLSTGCVYSLVTSGPYKAGTEGVVYHLPKQWVKLTIERITTGGDVSDNVKFELQEPVPDPDHTFVASLRHSRMASDTLEIKTSASGMLTSADAKSEDQTGPVIENLLETAARIAVLAATGFPIPPSAGQFTASGEVQKRIYEFLIDPSDPLPQSVSSTLEQLGYEMHAPLGPESDESGNQVCTTVCDGLVYRRPVLASLELRPLGQENVVASFRGLLPNGGPVGILPMRGSRFSTREHVVAFENGMLTSAKTVQPSEVAEAVGILPGLVERIGQVPTEILQLKIDYSSKEKSLLEQEAKLAGAQSELIKALDALEEARREREEKTPAADGGNPVEPGGGSGGEPN